MTWLEKSKEIGDTHNVTFLVVHHTRKEGDDDAVNTISGTSGIADSADGIFILQKENRLQNRANLLMVGRDVQTITLALEFDTETCKWRLLSHSDNDVTTAADPVLIAVSKLINAGCQFWEGTASDLLAELKAISAELDLLPNVLIRRLSSNDGLLLTKFGVAFSRTRTGKKRHVTLRFKPYDVYDKTDILETTPIPPNTDNTVHIVHTDEVKIFDTLSVPPFLHTGQP